MPHSQDIRLERRCASPVTPPTVSRERPRPRDHEPPLTRRRQLTRRRPTYFPRECTWRSNLSRTGDADRAGVIHDVGSVGHVQAARAEEQQHRGGDDGEQDVIHRLHADLLKETPVKARGNEPGSL
jgi:hypothetical protein